jgi:hypothetical protein
MFSGNHDGYAKGKRYFQCPKDHGIFVRLKRLSKRLIVPESFDPEKIGLYRERDTPSPRYWREASPVSSTHSSLAGGGFGGSVGSFARSPSRESSPRLTSPGGTPIRRSVSYAMDHHPHHELREGSPSAGSVGSIKEMKPLRIGERVIVASSVGETKAGTLRFLGPTDFAEG